MAASWGEKTSASQLTSITTEQFFDATPQLDPNEVAHCEVEVTFPGSPTDDAIVSVYGTLDASNESWDEVPLMRFTIVRASNAASKASWVMPLGIYKFRVGVQRSGTTDTLTSADFAYRVGTLA